MFGSDFHDKIMTASYDTTAYFGIREIGLIVGVYLSRVSGITLLCIRDIRIFMVFHIDWPTLYRYSGMMMLMKIFSAEINFSGFCDHFLAKFIGLIIPS
jgi:hypothetical protein